MKRKDLNNLKTKELKDLRKLLKDSKKELTKAKIELKMGNVKNVHEVKNKRKNIASILTFMSIKEKIEISKPKEKKQENEKIDEKLPKVKK